MHGSASEGAGKIMGTIGTANIGIAFGGGAARGWAHIGVLKALNEAGIRPSVIAGTSIGAVVGGCYVADRLEHLEEFARGLTRRKVFGYFDLNLNGSGLINGQKLNDVLRHALGEMRIEDMALPFTAVATEIGTGHEVWLSRGSVVDAIRASYAIPGVFRPVRLDNRWLFDGALVNPIPVTVCRALGAQYVIAVNLNADLFGLGTVLADVGATNGADTEADSELADPLASQDDGLSFANGWGATKLLQRQVFGRRRNAADNAPSISTVMVDAFNIVHDRIARSRLAGDPPDLMISPRLTGIGLFDFHRADELIERGYVAGKRILREIQEDLEAAPAAARPTVVHMN
ncbi:MAG: NTE family protein [Hyphomicrobiaceae bacterium]